MTERKDGGTAFPILLEDIDGNTRGFKGMSLRDYFAAAYLTGLVARGQGVLTPDERASLAYIHADAMLAERDK